MLKHEIGVTFSDIWYRVADTRPRLSPHAHFVRQDRAGHVSYIVEEPASGNYYRLTEAAYFFVGLLDGTRTVGQAWDACNAQLGDSAPTQRECLQLLGQLQSFGLLLGDLPLAPDMITERRYQARKRKRDRRTGKWIFYNLPLVNPEPFLKRHAGLARLLFSRPALVIWIAAIIAGLWAVLTNLDRLGSDLNLAGLLAPGNLFWLAVVFLALRAIHEMGHAMACKAFGGRVTEIGVILIAVVLPIPYCDATSAWRFPSTRDRVIVSFAGIMVETFAAALCAVLWAMTEPGLLNTLLFNTMIVSGVTTLFFNLNPLLRYDGYYILSDLAGSPNLAQRSKELWKYGLHRWVFGVRSMNPPHIRDSAEASLLWVFSALAWPYRMFILFAIMLIVSTQYLTIGIILATIVVSVVFIWPICKAIGYLASAPELIGRRARAVGVVAGSIALLVGFLGAVPMPAAAYASGTLEPSERANVRVSESGFLTEFVAEPGAHVEEGSVISVLQNPETVAEMRAAEAAVLRARAELDKASAASASERLVAERALATAEAKLERLSQRAADLRVRAPASGVLLSPAGPPAELRNLLGNFVRRGDLIGVVSSPDSLVLRVAVPDREAAYVFERAQHLPGGTPPASIRVKGGAGDAYPASITRIAPMGVRELPTEALSAAAGGDITIDPDDHTGVKALRPHFLFEITPDSLPDWPRAGLRARVRFELPPEPLLNQWLRKARQFLRDRFA